MNAPHNSRSVFARLIWAGLAVTLLASFAAAGEQAGAKHWYRGNTHTHSWWSDGDSPPETVVEWYRSRGYHFLVLSEHNNTASGEKWADLSKPGRAEAARRYEQSYSADWIIKRVREDKPEYLLKTIPQLQSRFEKPGDFILIPGEEITGGMAGRGIHVNGLNLTKVILPPKGRNFVDTAQEMIDAVAAQQQEADRPMLAILNHPNWKWAFTVEDLLRLKGLRFVEIYNGGGNVHNQGDDRHPSTERMWDILLTKRLAEYKMRTIYAVAADDAHGFNASDPEKMSAGRGWIMVRSARLDTAAILAAMNRGDFYASTGVMLDDIRYEDRTLRIAIHPKPGVTYRTQFIGTLRGYDPTSTSQPAIVGEPPVSRRYSPTIGKVLAEVEGLHPSYQATGEEIYIRAKVMSNREHPNSSVKGEFQCAWVQPVIPERSR